MSELGNFPEVDESRLKVWVGASRRSRVCEKALDGIADPAALVRDAKAMLDARRMAYRGHNFGGEWLCHCQDCLAYRALARHFPEETKV